MQWLSIPLVIVAGVLNAVESGTNAQLAKSLGSPWPAAIVVALVGLVGVTVAMAFVGNSWPGMDKIASVPWWAWIGGLFGAAYVLAMLSFAEQLGAALFTGLSVTAAIVASVVLDHFGWVGFKPHALNVWRALGAALMIGGVGLIARF